MELPVPATPAACARASEAAGAEVQLEDVRGAFHGFDFYRPGDLPDYGPEAGAGAPAGFPLTGPGTDGVGWGTAKMPLNFAEAWSILRSVILRVWYDRSR